jgi:hypothetical protein
VALGLVAGPAGADGFTLHESIASDPSEALLDADRFVPGTLGVHAPVFSRACGLPRAP